MIKTPANTLTKSGGAEEDMGTSLDKLAEEAEERAGKLLLLVSETCEIPVPGMDTVVRVRPFAILDTRYPFVPTL